MNRLYDLRKKTTVVHWLFGGLCAVVSYLFFPAGLTLLGVFGIWEMWNDRNLLMRTPEGEVYLPEGDIDWWESFIIYVSGIVVLIILQFCGILNIRWC